MDGHCVAVEVRVVRRTDERMHLDRVAFDEDRAECLDRLAVKCRCAVEQHVLVLDRLFEDRPHFRSLVFDEAACAADVVCKFAREESLDHERTEELEHHVLRKSAFVECQIRTHYDDGAARVVDALTEKVLAQVAVLTLEVISERLECAAAASEDAEHACTAAH